MSTPLDRPAPPRPRFYERPPFLAWTALVLLGVLLVLFLMGL